MNKHLPAATLLDALLRTDTFEQALLAPIDSVPFEDTHRAKLAMMFLGLAQEHWLSVRRLLGVGLSHSAIALVRLQFEATAKSFWIFHASDDGWIARYSVVEKGTDGSVIEPPIPPMREILEDIERSAPPIVHALLLQFKEIAWKQLNSYVHGGLHALANMGRRFPSTFLVEILCNSNGVAGLGAMHAASIINDADRVNAVLAAQYSHLDCLPKGPFLGQG